jgi:hypothetical protein
MSGAILAAIPWFFTEEPFLQWNWITDQFKATVTGVEGTAALPGEVRPVRAYSWELFDLIRPDNGMPRFLIEGMSESFGDAENTIREHVGKCYGPRYLPYTGHFATTFQILTGERLDFSKYVGTEVSLTIRQSDGLEKTLIGILTTHQYKLRLKTEHKTLEILPAHVVRVTNGIGETSTRNRASTYTGIGRIYASEWSPGCTGFAGYHPGTVDHAGADQCPIHEHDLPAMFASAE